MLFHNNVGISPWQQVIFKNIYIYIYIYIYIISYTQYKHVKNKQEYFFRKGLGLGEVKG